MLNLLEFFRLIQHSAKINKIYEKNTFKCCKIATSCKFYQYPLIYWEFPKLILIYGDCLLLIITITNKE